MKKIISSVVLLTVLAGAVTMIVGCGEKPAKESVWRNPNYDKSQLGIKLLAFHSDGNLYAFRAIQTTIGHSSVIEEKVKVIGKYSINAAKKTITISDIKKGKLREAPYIDSKDTLKLGLILYKKDPSISAEDLKKLAE